MEYPKFKNVPDKMLEIPQPGIGGLNLKDLEFEQEVNQTPYMLNMMYRNGAFGKRYGQEIFNNFTFAGKIYATFYFAGQIIVHAGTKVYKSNGTSFTEISGATVTAAKGLFMVYAQKLYYLQNKKFYQYDGTTWSQITPYVPDVLINCKPDGTKSDNLDEYNILGLQFAYIYNGDGTTKLYKSYDNLNIINTNVEPIVEIDGTTTTAFTRDGKNITFTTAPAAGNLNVRIIWTMKTTGNAAGINTERNFLLTSKYYATFGGSNNARLFLAGCGKSKYFYSASYDMTYFPENNWATIGNTEDDITGFGKQYNVLIVFKPKEVYSIYSFTQTSSSTIIQEDIGTEAFKSQLVNSSIGCDAPYTIQLINNQLTWLNSNVGICVLTSTSIVDERNIRAISRNVDRTNNFDVKGILDYSEDLNTIQSVDYDNKYFLVFPQSGMCFMWDYEIAPYYVSNGRETSTRSLDWYLFDNFYVGEFLKVDKELLYVCNKTTNNYDRNLIKLNESFSDVNFNRKTKVVDGVTITPNTWAIESYYMTPFFQFGAVEYLKNVKNIYVQCRGDTASVIEMAYCTDEINTREKDSESIRIGGRLYHLFQWSNFQWLVVSWAKVFRRKCNLKKIQMASFYFQNSEEDRDLSITHIGLQYQLVKYVR